MRHYHRYHGRRTSGWRGFLKVVIILLLLLLLLLLASTLFLQRYLVYGDDGIRLELPWVRQEEAPPSPSVSPSPPPIIKEEKPSESSPEPEPPDPTPPIHAVQFSPDALLSGAMDAELSAVGGDCVILTMKEDNGDLNYVSANELAIAAGASAADPALNTAIQELTAGDLYTVAQVSCFRDHRLPTHKSDLRLQTNSGYCWDDHQDVRWSSPASREVWDYLTALCVELAELGFDEILLTHCGFPTAEEGNLGWIKEGDAYPKGALDQVMAPFLTQLKTALEPYEINLSVRAQTAELKGETGHTGLTLNNVLSSCDRIWIGESEWTACAIAALAVDPELDPSRLLVSVQDTPGSSGTSWAILN